MLALAVDTSGDVAGVALGREDTLISELHFRHRMDLLRRLMPNIRLLVYDAGFTRDDIQGVVVGLGPGSFTGLRIGVAAAKALAYSLKQPLLGVPTLDVMAHGASPHKGFVCPVVVSKPGEVYAALYFADETNLRKVLPETAASPQALADRLKDHGADNVLFVGNGARRNWEAVCDMGTLAPMEYDYPRTSVLLAMGLERLAAGEEDDAFGLVPLYVRRPTPEVRLECR